MEFFFFFFFGGGGGGARQVLPWVYGTKASWRGTKANMSFTVETSRQLSFYQVFTAAIDGFATEGLGLLTIGD